MIRYNASWVVPISGRPVPHGSVVVDAGRVVKVDPAPGRESDSQDLGSVAILPGLVNAHTHLELSYLRGSVPSAPAFVEWIRHVIDARSRRGNPDAPAVLTAIDRAIEEALASGTALVGDISNTLVTTAPLGRSALAGVVFYELIRFASSDADAFVEAARQRLEALPVGPGVRTAMAAHAPYSVGPSVFRAIAEVARRQDQAPWSVHLSESAEEVEFIASGSGAWRTLLEQVGAWDRSWAVPGMSPVEYLDAAGVLDERVLAVHGVQMTAADLARLADRDVTLVTCPRSNAYTGAGAPPVEAFYRSGVRVAVGTDSLASTPDLNMFSELAAMRDLAPSVPAAAILDSATRQGARALGFGADYGSIEPGRRARLIAVTVPPDTTDVEEYLLSGIRPEDVAWLPES